MHAAIALGILTSEVNHPLFRDRLITFESEPQWVDLHQAKTLVEKVHIAQKAPWGGSTNIDKAFDLVLQVVEANRLPSEEIPDMIIFSDMQFDSACSCGGDAGTQLQRISRRFEEVGKRLTGKPYPTPRIVFWNLRGDTYGFPAQANTPNVQMLSGFSPSLLKLALSGEPMVVADEDTASTARGTKARVDPYVTFRRMVDDERYDAVRAVLDKSDEGLLVRYHFLPAVVASAAMNEEAQESELKHQVSQMLIADVDDDWEFIDE